MDYSCLLTGAIDAQYFGLLGSFDRSTECKSGFVAEIMPSVSGFVVNNALFLQRYSLQRPAHGEELNKPIVLFLMKSR